MKKKKFKTLNEKVSVILIVVFFGVLSFMTIGFASYQKILDFSGIAIVEPDGLFEIKSITLTSSSNVQSSETPKVKLKVILPLE